MRILLLVLAVVLAAPVAAIATTSGRLKVSVNGFSDSSTGCGTLDQGVGPYSQTISGADGVPTTGPPCTGGFVPTGDWLLSGSTSAGAWAAGATAFVSGTGRSADGATDLLTVEAGSSFSDEMTITVVGLSFLDPIKVAFDYQFSGSCGAGAGYTCRGEMTVRANSEQILRIFAAGSGTTAQSNQLNGNLFIANVGVFALARGDGSGSASGSWGSTARIVGFHVYDAAGIEFDPSMYSVTTASGTFPVPETSVLGLLSIAGVVARRRNAVRTAD